MPLASALYRGRVWHKRRSPRVHAFSYRLSLLWLDLDEQAQVFGLSTLWSDHWYSPMRFRESDYLSRHRHAHESLACCARRLAREHLDLPLDGPVRLLTQVRSFGLLFNPVSFFYCYHANGQLGAIIAEVSNTPWNERFCYLLPAQPDSATQSFSLDKAFHVSPFMPLSQTYRMRFSTPGQQARVLIQSQQNGQPVFDAALQLQRLPLSPAVLRREALSFPFMVIKTVTGIYWQALRLWLKRTPVFSHHPAANNALAARQPPNDIS